MDAWITWENGLFALALFIAVSSLIGLMKSMHDSMVAEISEKIEAAQKRRLLEETRKQQEEARREAILRREEHLERIRNNRDAA